MSSFDEHDASEAAMPLSRRAMGARPAEQADQSYLLDLNPAQREAVETLDGPVLMLAGAGTGKTKALMARVAHLLTEGRANARQILAVTFTNKAAKEMKDRLQRTPFKLQPWLDQYPLPWMGTFHAISVKILRRHAELAGLKSNFTILDTDDQLRLLRQVISAADIDEKRWPARMLAGLIDGWNTRALTPARVPSADAGACHPRGP
ncbi:MAG: UvrD-helicase domain-containing protein, partial [Cereibacter sp.]